MISAVVLPSFKPLGQKKTQHPNPLELMFLILYIMSLWWSSKFFENHSDKNWSFDLKKKHTSAEITTILGIKGDLGLDSMWIPLLNHLSAVFSTFLVRLAMFNGLEGGRPPNETGGKSAAWSWA